MSHWSMWWYGLTRDICGICYWKFWFLRRIIQQYTYGVLLTVPFCNIDPTLNFVGDVSYLFSYVPVYLKVCIATLVTMPLSPALLITACVVLTSASPTMELKCSVKATFLDEFSETVVSVKCPETLTSLYYYPTQTMSAMLVSLFHAHLHFYVLLRSSCLRGMFQ